MNNVEAFRPRRKKEGLDFNSVFRRILRLDRFIPATETEFQKRQAEIVRAFDEGKELIIKYDIQSPVRRLDDNYSEYINLYKKAGGKIELDDSRMAVYVPATIFPEIIKGEGVTHVYEEMGKYNDLARPPSNPVWFVTENKLRVSTQMGKGNPFYDEIVFPSYVAQLTRQVDSLEGMETFPGQIASLDRMLGFSVLDMTGEILSRVKRIALLEPVEAGKYKKGVPLFNLGKT